jgi:RNA polymerase sigma-70 factor, ECF subfamily
MIFDRRRDSAVSREIESVSVLYDCYAPRLLSLCLRYTGNRADAEDVLHDGFMKIIKNYETFSSRHHHSLEAWMKRIMLNTALNYIRDHKKEKFFLSFETDPLLQVAEEEHEESYAGMNLTKEELINMVCELPDGYRTVFNLYVMEDYSHKEISELLGCSENTSKSQLSKARAALRKRLAQHKEHELYKQQTGSGR